jgi:hypothetical protein
MTITCCIVVRLFLYSAFLLTNQFFRNSKIPYSTNVLPDDYRSSELSNGGVKMKINIFV